MEPNVFSSVNEQILCDYGFQAHAFAFSFKVNDPEYVFLRSTFFDMYS